MGLETGAGGQTSRGREASEAPTVASETGGGGELVSQVDITYYTDPLCSWSWAMEPHWRRLRYQFGDHLQVRYTMGGMVPDWTSFSDPLNGVERQLQMGPHWYHVRQQTDMPIDERLWTEDPPGSSYPASIAYEAARLQGEQIASHYLRRLREAVMFQRRNIGRTDVLLHIAREMADGPGPGLDADRLAQDLVADAAVSAFRNAVMDARYRDIGRFPTLIFRRSGWTSIITVGFRTHEMLRAALGRIAPDITPVRQVTDVRDYVAFWGSVTAAEIAVAFDVDLDGARRLLAPHVAAGTLTLSRRHLYQVANHGPTANRDQEMNREGDHSHEPGNT